MFVDASALCAMITDEDDASALLERLYATEKRVTSPLAVWETTLAVSRKAGIDILMAEEATQDFLRATAIEIIAIVPDITPLAIAAHRDFGKGRHPAALNFGDCFAYACARHYGLPLLFKGNDFSQTDIATA